MPEYFVCQAGPMGGCTILAWFATWTEAREWARARGTDPEENPYFIFHNVEEV